MSGKKKKKSNIFSEIIKILVAIIFFALFVFSVAAGVIIYLNSPLQSDKMPFVDLEHEGIRRTDDGAYYVDVRRGESSQSVGLRLERAGIIRNRYFWSLLSRYEREHIKIGTYRLEIPLSQIEIYRILVTGRQVLYRVTIPEGVTLKKTAILLEEAGICSIEDFLEAAKDPEILSYYGIPNATMEGYLFPDTYLFQRDFPASRVVRTMADNFYNRIEILDPQIGSLNPKELNDLIILASIVEREYRINEEAPLMAGVFFNRLRINMALQSCATVEYIITEIQGKPHPRVIYNQDLQINDPYNTYLRPGLPPGPISAPGAVALNAVLNPQRSDYLYFRLEDPSSGKHYFSRTFDEHIRAGQLVPKGQS